MDRSDPSWSLAGRGRVLRRLRALKYRLWKAWDGDWEVWTALRSSRSPLETESGLEEA